MYAAYDRMVGYVFVDVSYPIYSPIHYICHKICRNVNVKYNLITFMHELWPFPRKTLTNLGLKYSYMYMYCIGCDLLSLS